MGNENRTPNLMAAAKIEFQVSFSDHRCTTAFDKQLYFLRYQMQRKNVRVILLIISTFTYLLIGAAVFEKLEYRADLEQRHEIHMIAQKLHSKYNFTEKDYEILQAVVIKSVTHKTGDQWSFAGAFYFSVVVITTLGYGHSTPDTTLGKLFCMIFALAGIPLNLIMFQSIGERVNALIAYILRKIRSALGSRGYTLLREVSPKHLLFVSFSIGMAIIIMGTYVFHRFERWSLFEAYYYCFISLSTIGFGDYVPLQTDGILRNHPAYFAFTLLFIVGGLALFSASVNLLVLGFMAPNADSVTAKSRDPPHAIVLEAFTPTIPLTNRWSRSSSNLYLYTDRKFASLHHLARFFFFVSLICGFQAIVGTKSRDGSYDNCVYTPESIGSTIYCDDCSTSNGAVPFDSSAAEQCTCFCNRCEKRRRGRSDFVVRRCPTKYIGHIVNHPLSRTNDPD